MNNSFKSYLSLFVFQYNRSQQMCYNNVYSFLQASHQESEPSRPVHLCNLLSYNCIGLEESETLFNRDDALLYIAYVMLIWAAPIPADRWHCNVWPYLTPWVDLHAP